MGRPFAYHKVSAVSQHCWERIVKYVLPELISSKINVLSTWTVTHGLTVQCYLCHWMLASLLLHHKICAILCYSQNLGL